jgi:diguanylate cyclase (GGDEF)-like protein
VALVPIRSKDKIVGLIQLNDRRKGCFTINTVGLMEGVAAHIGEALMRKQAEEKVRYISFHDSLTGLYNRRYMEEEMHRLDTERQLPISIIMADVNGLKQINDTHGHRFGDELLEKVGGILREACRKEDIISRWGGDEFLVFLPQTCAKTAALICERIKNACRKTFVKDVAVSMALGVAEKNNLERSFTDIVRDADKNMYKDKVGKHE